MDRGTCSLVTGGQGFLGGRLVEALRARGRRVRIASSRTGATSEDVVHADLGDHAALARAVEGCDTVFHLAYAFARGAEDQRRLNLEGTLALAQAALAQGVRRFVHVGSVAAYGQQAEGGLDEQTPPRPEDAYARIKHEIDTHLLALHRDTGFPVIILQPTIVYGPNGGAWTREPLRQVRAGQVALPDRGEGLCNAIYVDDVVDAALIAAEREDATGQAFLISGPTAVTWGRFYRAYEAMAMVSSVVPMDDAQFDAALARRYGSIPSLRRYRRALEKVLGRLGLASRESLWLPNPALRTLYASHTRVRTEKARRMLGFEPKIDFDRGMALTAEWARAQKIA